VANLRSWWKKTIKPLDAVIVLVLVVLLALLVVIILGYSFNWSWTGFQRRTLYDWLQLLIIPVVLAIGGYLFNYTTGRNERQANEQRAQTEQYIALDNQRETALQAYIDNMSELLLHEGLRGSADGAEVRKIARARTLRVLPRLDGARKRSVLQFLHESEPIQKNNPVVRISTAEIGQADLTWIHLEHDHLNGVHIKEADLRWAQLYGAELRGTDLSHAKLSGADLREADLGWADLSHAKLSGADLSGAILIEANLTGATVTTEQLEKAKSLTGATMPEGSKHP